MEYLNNNLKIILLKDIFLITFKEMNALDKLQYWYTTFTFNKFCVLALCSTLYTIFSSGLQSKFPWFLVPAWALIGILIDSSITTYRLFEIITERELTFSDSYSHHNSKFVLIRCLQRNRTNRRKTIYINK